MYNYRLNPFVKVFQKEGICALYNTLSLETVYLKKDNYHSELLSPSQVLIDKNFLYPLILILFNILMNLQTTIQKKHLL